MSSTCPTCGQIVGFGHAMPAQAGTEFCVMCGTPKILCKCEEAGYSDGKVFKAAKYTETDIKQAKLEALEDVIDMLNKEAVDRNCEGVYRWNVPLSVAVDEINLLKQQIESE